jgi:putative ABC transport system permease protein
VLIVSTLAGSIATMAMTLVVRSTQPWDEAFERYAGPHLLFHFDASRVTPEQLQATGSLPGVVAAGPPYQTVEVAFKNGNEKGRLQLIGRSDPGGAVDRLPMHSGRWPQASGEIAVTRTEDVSFPFRPRIGDTIQALTDNGTVDFKVVGEVVNIAGHGSILDFSNGIAGAWVFPGDIAQFVDPAKARLGYEMSYRFQHAATEDELAADRRLIEAALPPGAETQQVVGWVLTRSGSIWLIEMLSSIIISFTVFAVLALAVIVGTVVAGLVLSSYRDIGITKAMGFSPIQVLAVYTGQMLLPAVVGAVLGLPIGVAASRPFLDDVARSLQLPPPSVFDPVVLAGVPAAIALLTAAAALIPAIRAAGTNSVRAMALGTAPPVTRRSRIAALLARMRAPRALSLGAGDAFARPVRGFLTLTALALGIATATFAMGFQNNILDILINDPASYGYAQDVVVSSYPGLTDEAVMARLSGQPETRQIVALVPLSMRVAGQKDPHPIYAMRGDARALGYRAQRGRWFERPGEAVISAGIAKESNLRIGNTFSGALIGGPSLTLRLVGLANDFNTVGGSIRISWETLTAVLPGVSPEQYLVKLAAGADAAAYAKRIAAIAPNSLAARATLIEDRSVYADVITWMVGALALILLAISAAGVFNATLLTTRERVRDISILKAVGMTSGQIALMAAGSTLVLVFIATWLGVPLGLWMQRVILDAVFGFYGAPINPDLALGPVPLAIIAAFVLALLGAALPARWAAATPVAQVLHSE